MLWFQPAEELRLIYFTILDVGEIVNNIRKRATADLRFAGMRMTVVFCCSHTDTVEGTLPFLLNLLTVGTFKGLFMCCP